MVQGCPCFQKFESVASSTLSSEPCSDFLSYTPNCTYITFYTFITMAEEQLPVYYEDLAALEKQFDEVDREISSFLAC